MNEESRVHYTVGTDEEGNVVLKIGDTYTTTLTMKPSATRHLIRMLEASMAEDEEMNKLTPDENKILVDAIHDSATIIHTGKNMNEREQIGWCEREEGFYPMYAPERGSIVTQAFIHCKYCGGAIYHCMGPRWDAVCLTCFEKDVEAR